MSKVVKRTKLKPCPFCGSPAFVEDHTYVNRDETFWFAGCTNGKNEEGHDNCIGFDMGTPYWTRYQAVKAWNKRA